MKNCILISLLILSNLSVFSQGRVETVDLLWSEKFDGKTKHFKSDRKDAPNLDYYVSDGMLKISKIGDGYYNSKFNDANINQAMNFTIRAKFKFNTSVLSEKSYGGLTWGYKDLDNASEMLFYSDGSILICKRKNEGRINVYDEIPFEYSMDDWINVKIEKSGFKYLFYVNEKLIHQTMFWPFRGNDIGFKVNGDMEMYCDEIIIHQRRKVNVAAKVLSPYKKENLEAPINTPHDESHAIISHDGTEMYIIATGRPGASDKKKQDLWHSVKKGDKWSTPVNLGKPINNSGHNYLISVLGDGNTLILGNQYNSDGTQGSEGMSTTSKVGNGKWALPEDVDVVGYSNDGDYGGGSISASGKVMVLTYQDRYSKGMNDLYVSFNQGGGKWTKPKNMGSVVNSFHQDYGVFIAADERTLYFCSQGHPGYGGADVFVTKRLDDSWLNWSKPLNLGRSINTEAWDGNYSVEASGELAYLTSYKRTHADIYEIRLQDELKPDPVVILQGRVLDSKTGKPVGANLKYHELDGDKERGGAKSDPTTGKYSIVLTAGHEYSFYAKSRAYASIHYTQNQKKIDKYNVIEHDIYLTPLEVNEVVVLNNVFFEVSKEKMLPKSEPELDRLIDMLKEHPHMKIELRGHTNPSKAPQSWHMNLSEKRAEVVYNYLLNKGIAPARLTHKGYGDKIPANKGSKVNDKVQNMRVEFKITKL